MTRTFRQRLERVKLRGNLRDADLARWVGRRQSTIRGWLAGREPAGTPTELTALYAAIERLEFFISAGRLPLPYVPAKTRIAYLKRLGRVRSSSRVVANTGKGE